MEDERRKTRADVNDDLALVNTPLEPRKERGAEGCGRCGSCVVMGRLSDRRYFGPMLGQQSKHQSWRGRQ